MGEVCGWKEGSEPEVLFEADDAVLDFEVVNAGLEGEDGEGGGDEDPPEMERAVLRPVMDGEVDGDEEVD